MSKNFPDNIRSTKGLDDTQLRASLEAFGWKELFPAIKDQDGKVLVGHRRLVIAAALGIAPVERTVKCANDKERWEIAVASNVGHAGMSKDDRQRIAQRMYTDGSNLTQAQIAAVLNVSQAQISSDLSGTNKSKHAKTATNPKGSGRPKGAKSNKTKDKPVADKQTASKPSKVTAEKPKTDRSARKKNSQELEQRAACLVLDEGMSYKDAIVETGLDGSEQVVKTAVAEEVGARRLAAKLHVDPKTLAMSAQEKLAAAIRQEKRKLEAEFAERVRVESVKRGNELANYLLEKARKQEKDDQAALAIARNAVKQRGGGLIARAVFNLIRSCLHSDSRKSASDEKLNRAFHAFSAMEKIVIVDEPERMSNVPPLPKSAAEWDALKAKVDAERRAKRAAAKSTVPAR